MNRDDKLCECFVRAVVGALSRGKKRKQKVEGRDMTRMVLAAFRARTGDCLNPIRGSHIGGFRSRSREGRFALRDGREKAQKAQNKDPGVHLDGLRA